MYNILFLFVFLICGFVQVKSNKRYAGSSKWTVKVSYLSYFQPCLMKYLPIHLFDSLVGWLILGGEVRK